MEGNTTLEQLLSAQTNLLEAERQWERAKENYRVAKEGFVGCMLDYETIQETIGDILTTAFEGGVNHWVSRVEVHTDTPSSHYEDLCDWTAPNWKVLIYDLEENCMTGKENDPYILTRACIEDALKRIFTLGMKPAFPRLMQLMYAIKGEDYDANDADDFIQYTLFNEFVYS